LIIKTVTDAATVANPIAESRLIYENLYYSVLVFRNTYPEESVAMTVLILEKDFQKYLHHKDIFQRDLVCF